MDNRQSVFPGEEIPSVDHAQPGKAASTANETTSRPGDKASGIKGHEEKKKTAGAGMRQARPLRLLKAGKGLQNGVCSGQRPDDRKRPAMVKPLKTHDVRQSALKTAHPGPRGTGSAPAPKPITIKTKDDYVPTVENKEKATPKKILKAAPQEAKKTAEAAAKPSSSAEPAAEGPKCDLYPGRKVPLATIISYFFLSMVLLGGWLYRGEEVITAKEGTGYFIGIAGGVMMLLLILYPIRKTARFMRRMGPIKHWFRLHMVFGLIGPSLILFHANFAMGSLNSSVTMAAMLLVAGSGLVGRYIYSHIHYGLYGKEMDLAGLKKDFETGSKGMVYVLDFAPAVRGRLLAFDAMALRPRYSFPGSLAGIMRTFFSALLLRIILLFSLGRTLHVAARRRKWSLAEKKAHGRATRLYITNHIAAAMAISRFKVYERLFSLWHILHMPLFFMLILTAIIHVIAVHMF